MKIMKELRQEKVEAVKRKQEEQKKAGLQGFRV